MYVECFFEPFHRITKCHITWGIMFPCQCSGHVDHDVLLGIRKQIPCHNAAWLETSNTKNPYNISLYICISDRWESMLQCIPVVDRGTQLYMNIQDQISSTHPLRPSRIYVYSSFQVRVTVEFECLDIKMTNAISSYILLNKDQEATRDLLMLYIY
jgi:hypothetical protein